MKRDVILAGVGGQGLLSLAAVIAEAALELGLYLKESEVHGMAQRGGSVTSYLRFSERPIHSDLIPEGTADLILALEPMEGLRYAHLLVPAGAFVSSSASVRNLPAYPPEEAILAAIKDLPCHVLVDAPGLAEKAGSPQCANLVVLGAGTPFLGLPEEALVAAIHRVFQGRPEAVVERNVKGFRLGLEAARGEG